MTEVHHSLESNPQVELPYILYACISVSGELMNKIKMKQARHKIKNHS